jgi:hypothetical protein
MDGFFMPSINSVSLVHPDFSREEPRFEPVCSHRIKKPSTSCGWFFYAQHKLSFFSASRLQSGGAAVRTRVLPQNKKNHPLLVDGFFMPSINSVSLVHPDFSREGPRFEPVCSHRIKKPSTSCGWFFYAQHKLSFFSASRLQSGGSAVRTRVLPPKKYLPLTDVFLFIHFYGFIIDSIYNFAL